jgi:hypothetical protein
MTCPDFTTVVGVDAIHLEQLRLVWPTWRKHKPDLLKHPMLIFYDPFSMVYSDARYATDHPDVEVIPWSIRDYDGVPGNKWLDPQRYKMLAGHVYMPAEHVRTDYWLKLDTDTVATGCPDWIDPAWFASKPAIVSQPWGYTKPADQMQKLDEWAEKFSLEFPVPRLNLQVEPDASMVRHSRIISWIGFFDRKHLGWLAAKHANLTCGYGKLPCRSQDGFHWYCATRMGWEVQTHDFRQLGWEHHGRMKHIRRAVERAMK